jgi:hypothetical protein
MQIQDFNRPSAALDAGQAPAAAPLAEAMADAAPEAGESRGQAEITLLKKRIEHLELVVETARSLMTSNQERLLRRLHDLPQELMTLTAALGRLDGEAPSRVTSFEPQAQARRVA